MWHSCAVHKSLPNLTNHIRLSLNTLTYPARLPTIWHAEKTIPELQVWWENPKALAAAEGIDVDDDLFERMAIEAMSRGGDVSREVVVELAEALA